MENFSETSRLFSAISFAAEKHKKQHRKGRECIPYINHPIEVAQLLIDHGEADCEVLMAAILHDTIEDTDTSSKEIEDHFGARVSELVLELSDDKNLTKKQRKLMQVKAAPLATRGAQAVKLADKIANVRDIAKSPPAGWTVERKQEYLEWAVAVVDGLRGVNPSLEELFDRQIELSRDALLSLT